MTRDEKQYDAVRKWIKAGGRGIFSHPTGFGKTRCALMAIKSFMSKNKDKLIRVIVPTEYLKEQWTNTLIEHGLSGSVGVEIINSAIKNPENVDLLIIDEIHRAVSKQNIKIFDVKKPKLILGLSATFNRLDGRHNLILRDIPVVDLITIKEALSKGWLSDYKEYKVFLEPDDIDEYREMSRQFSEAFSVFDFDFKLAMKCLTNIIARRTYGKQIGIKPKDMDAIVFTWNRALKGRKAYVNNHPLKIDVTRKILDYRPNKKAITFAGTIKQAEKIGRGHVIHSGKTKKKNRIDLAEFNSMPSGVLCTSKMLDEGADIKGLSLAVILSNSSSSIQLRQRLGRVIRKEGDKEAEIFHLVLKGTVEENWSKNASQGMDYIEINESELDKILKGEKLDALKTDGEKVDQIFRL